MQRRFRATRQSVEKEIQTTIGATFSIELQIQSSASINAATTESGAVSIDATDTGGLYIDPLTAGVGVQSSSGFDYSTPTAAPEPSTLTLVAAGLAGVALIRRRRVKFTGA